MWIRSQNKKYLALAKRIGIMQSQKPGGIKHLIINQVLYQEVDDYDVLGEYETEARAIEVLGDIVKSIAILETLRLPMMSGEVDVGKLGEFSVVFQMPEK